MERIVADDRDEIAIKFRRDVEGGRADAVTARNGRFAAGLGVGESIFGECPRTARCREAHGEQEGQNGRHDSLDRHQALPTPGPCSRTAGAYLHDPLAGGVLVRCYRRRGLP